MNLRPSGRSEHTNTRTHTPQVLTRQINVSFVCEKASILRSTAQANHSLSFAKRRAYYSFVSRHSGYTQAGVKRHRRLLQRCQVSMRSPRVTRSTASKGPDGACCKPAVGTRPRPAQSLHTGALTPPIVAALLMSWRLLHWLAPSPGTSPQ